MKFNKDILKHKPIPNRILKVVPILEKQNDNAVYSAYIDYEGKFSVSELFPYYSANDQDYFTEYLPELTHAFCVLYIYPPDHRKAKTQVLVRLHHEDYFELTGIYTKQTVYNLFRDVDISILRLFDNYEECVQELEQNYKY